MPDNPHLAQLFNEDQAERMVPSIDWDVLTPRDATRQKLVRHMLANGDVHTARDYYHAAMIFQHAPSIEDARVAQQLAQTSMERGDERARWLYAAATDRLLMKMGKKQKFGTQFVQDTTTGTWQLYQYDKRTSNTLRGCYNVPSIEEQLARVHDMR